MSSIPTLPGVTSQMVETPRLRTHALFSGPADGVAVLFVHGNASSSTFWEETMVALPSGFRSIAVDLRGYGDTEDKLVDATRGYGDWVDDLMELTRALGLERYHVVGHSMGGALRSACSLRPVPAFSRRRSSRPARHMALAAQRIRRARHATRTSPAPVVAWSTPSSPG